MAKIITDEQKIRELLEKNVEEVIEKESLIKKLKSGKQLRIKLGADPSRPDLHLGHAVVLRKLKEFQDLGHKIIFIIGDYTGIIGDPSGKSKTRPQLSAKEAKENARTYFKQVSQILDVKKTEIRYNSEWFSKIKFIDILNLVSKFTAQRILERDDFTKRIKENQELGMNELLYPIMQAYDSVVLKADVEIGGTDQKFNMLTGRKLQKKMELPEQDVITMPLMIGLDGKNKMSKSLDNYIGITEKPDKMFGKIMSIPDDLIIHYFELGASAEKKEIDEIKNKLAGKNINPRDIKIQLAEEIVKLYHNKETAKKAKEEFIKVFSKKEFSDDIQIIKITEPIRDLVYVLLQMKVVSSKSQAWRLIKQNAVEVNEKVIDNPKHQIEQNDIIRAGKKYFSKVIYEN